MPVDALVTPEVMLWARVTRGYDIEQAAKKIGRPSHEIRAWEEGSQCPTMPQARKAAEVYKRALAVLYLPEPPSGYEVLRDFRRLPDDAVHVFSPELLMLIRECRSRQQWLREFRQDEGAELLSFLGSANTDANHSAVAESARALIALSHEELLSCRTREDALSVWIEHVEDAGIYVVRDSSIPCAEARGFALCDPYAPFIFVNSKDAKAAQVFTLAHELAHLLIDVSGVSNLEHSGQWQIPDAKVVEVFCNRVAGQIVLPNSVFDRVWNGLSSDTSVEERIEKVADKCKVSSDVVARRLLDKRIVSEQEYRELHDSYTERWLELQDAKLQASKARGEPPQVYYPMMVMRNGRALTRIVLGAYFAGAISGREAWSVLNVKVDKFNKLAGKVGMYAHASRGGVP